MFGPLAIWRADLLPPAGRALRDKFWGPIWKMVQDKVAEAYCRRRKRGLFMVVFGAFLLETVPSVIYILMRHGNDPEESIVRAVNDTKDNDTIAAIVGAAVGALHGKKAIPERWVCNLSGRTTERDNGKVLELIAIARDRFWPARVKIQMAGMVLIFARYPEELLVSCFHPKYHRCEQSVILPIPTAFELR